MNFTNRKEMFLPSFSIMTICYFMWFKICVKKTFVSKMSKPCLLSKSEFYRGELLLCRNSVFSPRSNFTDVSFFCVYQYLKHRFLHIVAFPTSQAHPNGILNIPSIYFRLPLILSCSICRPP